MTAKLPTLRKLTSDLRSLNAYADGPDTLALVHCMHQKRWVVVSADMAGALGSELIPGDGFPFDAVAAARRLLAAVRDAKVSA